MNYKPLLITILGFIGFTAACYILFNRGEKKKSGFHEIEYNAASVADNILSLKTAALEVTALKARADSVPHNFIKILDDSVRKVEMLKLTYRLDTSLSKRVEAKLVASINLDSLKRNDTLFCKTKLTEEDSVYAGGSKYREMPLYFTLHEPELKGDTSKHLVKLPVRHFSSDIDFITKYPGFGAWALFITISFSCIFIIAGLALDANMQLVKLVSDSGCGKGLRHLLLFVICIVLLCAFISSSMDTFYDEDVVRNLYFLKRLDTSVGCISIVGYTTAALCFAGMLYTAGYVKCFQKKIDTEISKNQLLQSQIDDLGLAIPQAPTQIEKINKQAKFDQLNQQVKSSKLLIDNASAAYQKLYSLFKYFFYCTAILLALLTFCTGALHSAIDTLDFVRLIKRSMGFSPVRYDFVYLYATLHTLLLLLFFLPGQLLFSSYTNKTILIQPQLTEKTIMSGFKTQFDGLGKTLVATAPLLASFVQWLLNLIFES